MSIKTSANKISKRCGVRSYSGYDWEVHNAEIVGRACARWLAKREIDTRRLNAKQRARILNAKQKEKLR